MYCASSAPERASMDPIVVSALDKGVVLNLRRYVPCEWGHAVLNIQDTIGMAVEFKYRYTDGT